MMAGEEIRVVTVDAENVGREGFFCFKSKVKSPGYQRKLAWTKSCFAEGMKIKILYEGKRSIAFIEYLPGEATWRAIEATGYTVIHCMWVVGTGKGKGYASQLLAACEEDARAAGSAGLVMLSSSGNWLNDNKFFMRKGFQSVAQLPPFDLLVKRWGDAPLPTFPGGWEERAARFGDGLTVLLTGQCPYLVDATETVREVGQELGIPVKVVEPRTAAEARALAPSPYGVFSIVYNGKLLAYHFLEKKDLLKLLG